MVEVHILGEASWKRLSRSFEATSNRSYFKMAQKAAALSAAEFEKRYVTTNLRPDAPKYSDTLVEKYLADLSELDPEGLKDFKYAILVSVSDLEASLKQQES